MKPPFALEHDGKLWLVDDENRFYDTAHVILRRVARLAKSRGLATSALELKKIAEEDSCADMIKYLKKNREWLGVKFIRLNLA